MSYVSLAFEIDNETINEIFVAYLSDIGFSGFEEQDNRLLAFIEEEHYNEKEVKDFAASHNVSFELQKIEQINWNEKWEQEFQPVIVGDFCTVRAHFHNISVATRHDIVITPKMSFGTGHHATTQLMIKKMEHLHMADKQVLDFGTGTGVLAILAEKLTAAGIVAIDNDEWSVENTNENIERNNCRHITTHLGSLDVVGQQSFDIILANINRHILLQYMQQMYIMLQPEGQILMSGLLKEDKTIICEAAQNSGFKLKEYDELNNWIVLSFDK